MGFSHLWGAIHLILVISELLRGSQMVQVAARIQCLIIIFVLVSSLKSFSKKKKTSLKSCFEEFAGSCCLSLVRVVDKTVERHYNNTEYATLH